MSEAGDPSAARALGYDGTWVTLSHRRGFGCFTHRYLFVDYGVDINSYLAHLPFCGDVINPGKGEDWKGSLLVRMNP